VVAARASAAAAAARANAAAAAAASARPARSNYDEAARVSNTAHVATRAVSGGADAGAGGSGSGGGGAGGGSGTDTSPGADESGSEEPEAPVIITPLKVFADGDGEDEEKNEENDAVVVKHRLPLPKKVNSSYHQRHQNFGRHQYGIVTAPVSPVEPAETLPSPPPPPQMLRSTADWLNRPASSAVPAASMAIPSQIQHGNAAHLAPTRLLAPEKARTVRAVATTSVQTSPLAAPSIMATLGRPLWGQRANSVEELDVPIRRVMSVKTLSPSSLAPPLPPPPPPPPPSPRRMAPMR
ncbi:unnamed protein product, partial [Phaeothamnion confervicola]